MTVSDPDVTPVLPVLVANDKTRTGNDALIYYNLGQAKKLGQIVCTAPGESIFVPEASCAEPTIIAPPSGFIAVRVAKYQAGVTAIALGTVMDYGKIIHIPLQAPIGTAYELADVIPEDPTTFTPPPITAGGTAGDAIDVFLLPHPADDVLICYDQGFSMKPGTTLKPIPRKLNPVDHYVTQRAENTLSLNDLDVSNWRGIRRIKNQPVTIIVRLIPDGQGAPSEIQYYTNAVVNLSLDNPADGNDSRTVSGEGTFNQDLVFSADDTE